MKDFFKDLKVIELAGVLAGPSVGLFFTELGAKVIKIENPKTNGDITRSWKLATEDAADNTSAYYWSVNSGKEVLFLDLSKEASLFKLYELIKSADILITNYKTGDDLKLKTDYKTVSAFNPQLIYASINGFGTKNPRTAYDLILQAESGFMFMNGEKNAGPLKMPVAFIDLLAGHQLKQAILIALLQKYKTQKGVHVSVSLMDTAIASLANQATNWLIAHHLPTAQGSLHPNIAPYGEIFTTLDGHTITFAIGSDKQFMHLCENLKLELHTLDLYKTNQQRVKNRESLYTSLNQCIQQKTFEWLYHSCITLDIPIGKIRTLKEVFELPEAQHLLHDFTHNHKALQNVSSVSFTFED